MPEKMNRCFFSVGEPARRPLAWRSRGRRGSGYRFDSIRYSRWALSHNNAFSLWWFSPLDSSS